MADNKRNVRNFLINPEFQTKLIIYFFSVSMAITGLMVFFINKHSADIWMIASNINHVEIAELEAISNALSNILFTSIFCLVLGLFGTIIFGVVISHRIAGPMFAILKYIDQLIAGDYVNKRTLRPYDELNPIMDKLHQLADKLKK